MDQPTRSSALRATWWWFLLPIVVVAATRDWWAPDEPRYAMIARWIYEHGEFLVLRRCGELYPDKPPLVYWIAGLCGVLSGWSEFAMRLVSVASIAAVAWMTARLARRWWSEFEARWAPILLLGFALIFWNGGRLALDPLLTAGCVGALYFGCAGAANEREAARQLMLAGLCAGVAMFAKGPVALVNFGLPLALWRWSGLAADGPRAPRKAWYGAVALGVLPVLTWAVLACLREPALWRPLFFGQHLERAVEGTHHKGPPWENLVNMPGFLLPWTVPVVLGVVLGFRAWRARRRREEHDEGLVRAWLWFAGLFVFFSAIPAKRELYLMTAYPACALLAARWLASAVRAQRVGGLAAFVPSALFAAFAAAFAFGVPVVRWLYLRAQGAGSEPLNELYDATARDGLAWQLALVALPFAAGAALAARAAARREVERWAAAVGATWCVGLTVALVVLAPVIDPLKSDRSTAALLAARPEKPSEIPCYGTAADGVRFYGGGPCVQAENAGLKNGEIEQRLEREGAQFLALVDGEDFAQLEPGRQAHFRILERRRVGDRDVLVLGAPLR